MPGERPPRPATPFPGQQTGVGNDRVYAADMEDLRQRLDELIDIGRQILSRLAEL